MQDSQHIMRVYVTYSYVTYHNILRAFDITYCYVIYNILCEFCLGVGKMRSIFLHSDNENSVLYGFVDTK